MKKQKLGLALTAVLLLTGCGGIEKMTETTVTVDDSGTVEELLLEDFSDETYKEKELAAQINELVEAYNKEAGSEAVSVKSMQVKDKKAKVQLEYQSVADYRGFNQIDFFAGTVKEAQEEGYALLLILQDAEGKDVSRAGMPDGCEKQQVIIIREPMQVLVPGTIQYVSKNMKVSENKKSGKAFETDEGYRQMKAHATTQAYGYVIYTDNN